MPMKLKDILKPKPKTSEQIKNDEEYYEYGHPNFSPGLNFDDCMTICSFDREDMLKKIKTLNELDEE